MRRTITTTAAVLALLVPLSACGDDDDSQAGTEPATETDSDAGATDLEEYCELSAELAGEDAEPTDEDLDRIIAIAPEEIADDVALQTGAVREAIETGDFTALDSPEVEEADARREAFEEESCA